MLKEVVVIKVQKARLSFPRLFVPKAFSVGQKPRYEATFLLDPSNKEHAATIAQIKAEAKRVATEKWNDKIPKNLHKCYGTAEEMGKEYDGYAGMFCIASANKRRPRVLNRDRSDIVEDNGELYAGCYVNGSIDLWAWDYRDPESGKILKQGINANLRGVQKNSDGESFGVRPADVEEEFDALEDDGDSNHAKAASASDDWDV